MNNELKDEDKKIIENNKEIKVEEKKDDEVTLETEENIDENKVKTEDDNIDKEEEGEASEDSDDEEYEESILDEDMSEDEFLGGSENRKRAHPFKKMPEKRINFKSIVLLIFMIVIVITLPRIFQVDMNSQIKDISYTSFTDYVKNDQLRMVKEKEGYLYGSVFESSIENNQEVKKEIIYKTRLLSNRLADDEKLLDLLKSKNIDVSSEAPKEMPYILKLLIGWLPIIIITFILFFMINRMNRGGGGSSQIFNVGKSKAKEGDKQKTKVTFGDVAGAVEAKEELKEIVEYLKHPKKYIDIGAKIPKGVLLMGEPGTGKTLLAKAVAGEADVPFFSISGSEFVEMFVGVGASRVRDLFGKARKSSPCIVFIDEIDAVGRKRGSGQGGGNDEREQTLNQLLVEMDGFGNEETIIVLAATNRPDVLDSALKRPGRFDRQVYVDRPDVKGRLAILNVHAKNKKLAKDIDLEVIAKKTIGFVGADLANLLNEAALLAAKNDRKVIIMEDLEEASEKVSMGPQKKSKVIHEEDKYITAYHEVGHALLQWMLPSNTTVHKVTVIPRGGAAGYMMPLPTEDKDFRSKFEYLNEIRVLLAGRAAEEVIFGDVTTGADSDLNRATTIARLIVKRFGMVEELGPIMFEQDSQSYLPSAQYSEETAKALDAAVSKIMTEAYSDAKSIITKNLDLMEKITAHLFEKETLMAEEFEKIIGFPSVKVETYKNKIEKIKSRHVEIISEYSEIIEEEKDTGLTEEA